MRSAAVKQSIAEVSNKQDELEETYKEVELAAREVLGDAAYDSIMKEHPEATKVKLVVIKGGKDDNKENES